MNEDGPIVSRRNDAIVTVNALVLLGKTFVEECDENNLARIAREGIAQGDVVLIAANIRKHKLPLIPKPAAHATRAFISAIRTGKDPAEESLFVYSDRLAEMDDEFLDRLELGL